MYIRFALIATSLSFLLVACDGDLQIPTQSQVEQNVEYIDAELRYNVEAALAAATDLPRGLTVQVIDGIATISGSLDCDDCGGMRTPGTLDTIQQSLGAIVRAVPGISDVRFFFLVSASESTN